MLHAVFRLYGPLSSWGDIAPGTHRPTLALPTRSAVLGLLASALGIERSDEASHEALSKRLGIAVRSEAEGVLLVDYHTVQSPTRERRAVWPTRRDELGGKKVNTILTSRDYLQDVAYTVAVWDTQGSHERLKTIIEALDRPRFAPYLGRRSCPPALPFAPRLIDAASLKEAFDAATFPDLDLEVIRKLSESSADAPMLRVEFDAYEHHGFDHVRIQRQRDEPLSRSRRTFLDRTVHTAVVRRSEPDAS